MPTIRMEFWKLICGFFRYPLGGETKIYLAVPYGSWTLSFPVVDGRISDSSVGAPNIFPLEEVEVIPREEFEQYGLQFDEMKQALGLSLAPRSLKH